MVSTSGIKTGVPIAVVPAELTEGVVTAKVLSSIVVSGKVVPKLVPSTDVELRAVHKWYPGKYLLQKRNQLWCFFLQNWCQVL